MKMTNTYLKNSNTGELVMKKSFSESKIKHPDYFFDLNGKSLEDNKDLKGFVEIKEKTFKRESKLQKK